MKERQKTLGINPTKLGKARQALRDVRFRVRREIRVRRRQDQSLPSKKLGQWVTREKVRNLGCVGTEG